LAAAATAFLAAPKGELEGGVVAWWETDSDGLRAVLAPREVLTGAIWARAGGPPASLVDSGVDSGEGESVRGLPGRWRVRAGDVDSPELAAFDRQQRWLQGLLGLALVAGCAGGFFVFRAVRREMEMAARQAEFVAAVSHEFRTPLAGIRQLVTLLERDRVPEEGRRREYYAMMGRECARLTRLVDNVLDFSRMETGRKEYRMEELEMAAFLRDVAVEFGHAGAPVEAAIPEGLPVLRGDREALATAVRNLLDNAVKYGGRAWLSAEALGERVAIHVRDEGPGIAAEEQGRIFERFYRTPGDGARRVKGVGLGLALVKRIVEAHGGTVRVESEPGQGSVFTIELEGVGR
jgi:signal transduction histidine kinase